MELGLKNLIGNFVLISCNKNEQADCHKQVVFFILVLTIICKRNSKTFPAGEIMSINVEMTSSQTLKNDENANWMDVTFRTSK